MNALTKFKEVWLCDDDEDDHFVFAEALRQVLPEARLTSFPNGSELLFQLDQHVPDILFLDINMPMVNGHEALKMIKEKNKDGKLPVIMYSVSTQPADINSTYSGGAVLYLVKPQLFQELVQQLKSIFALDWDKTDEISSLQFNGAKYRPFNS